MLLQLLCPAVWFEDGRLPPFPRKALGRLLGGLALSRAAVPGAAAEGDALLFPRTGYCQRLSTWVPRPESPRPFPGRRSCGLHWVRCSGATIRAGVFPAVFLFPSAGTWDFCAAPPAPLGVCR